MKNIILQHLVMWSIAGILLAGLWLTSGMPDRAGAKDGRVQSPRGAITLYQDSTGTLVTYRRGLANGAR